MAGAIVDEILGAENSDAVTDVSAAVATAFKLGHVALVCPVALQA